VARCGLEKAVSVGATVRPRGLEFGVLSREVAFRRPANHSARARGDYRGVCSCPGTGPIRPATRCALAAVEAFWGAWESDVESERVLAGFAYLTSPGRLEVVLRARRSAGRRGAQPGRRPALSTRPTRLFGSSGWSASWPCWPTGRARHARDPEPILNESWSRRTTSSRALDPEDLGSVASTVVRRRPGSRRGGAALRLDLAVTLAEAEWWRADQ